MTLTSTHAIFRDAPRSSHALRVTLCGEQDDSSMRFFIWKDVLEELRYATSFHAPSSSLCILTGLYGLAPDGPFLEVTGFQDLLCFDEPIDEPTLHDHVQESLEALISDRVTSMDAVNPSGIGLMWHTPGSAARLHESAMRLHLSLFNVPYQFVLALDAPADRVALYSRRPRHPFFNAAIHVIEPLDEGEAAENASSEEQ